MSKNLSYFMRNNEAKIVTAAGPDTFKDENGDPIMFEIKTLTQAEITKITNNYKKRTILTDSKGNPVVSGGEAVWKTEQDHSKAGRHIIVEALQYPNLKDPELMQFYNCVDVTEMPLLVFPTSKEFNHVSHIVMAALGMAENTDEEDTVYNEAKN